MLYSERCVYVCFGNIVFRPVSVVYSHELMNQLLIGPFKVILVSILVVCERRIYRTVWPGQLLRMNRSVRQ